MKKIYCALILCIIILSGCVSEKITTGPLETENHIISLNEHAKEADVDLSFGVGNLTINRTDDDLFSGDFTTNVRDFFPKINYQDNSGKGSLSIQPKNSRKNIIGNVKNKWDLSFTNQLPLSFNVKLGVGENELNFDEMILSGLDIKTGVGSTIIDLSTVKTNSFDVNVKSGVGSTTIIVPKDAAVSIDVKKGIGEVTVDGLVKEANQYKTTVDSDEIIKIKISQGVGEVHLKAK